MTEREALTLALKALETSMYPQQKQLQAITAIKEALAQPEQECKSPEPKARRPDVHCPDKTCGFLGECRFGYKPEQEPKCGAIIEVFGKDWRLEYLSLPVGKHKLYTQQYTYTTPPQRTWVGLTEEDLKLLSAEWGMVYGAWMDDFARAIEAKLKEKNT